MGNFSRLFHHIVQQSFHIMNTILSLLSHGNHIFQNLEIELDRCKHLTKTIVNFPGDAPSFVFLRLDTRAGKNLQFFFPLEKICIELSVDHRNRVLLSK